MSGRFSMLFLPIPLPASFDERAGLRLVGLGFGSILHLIQSWCTDLVGSRFKLDGLNTSEIEISLAFKD